MNLDRVLRVAKKPSLRIKPIIIGWLNLLFNRKKYLRDERLKTCVSCPFISFDTDFYCGVCDCDLEIKTRVKSEKCPHTEGDKWI